MMHQVCQGDAHIEEIAPGHYRLRITSDGTRYCNAQLDDYHHLPRRHYPWRAPVHLSLWAKLPVAAQGTFGFGFWNAPYSPLAGQWLSLPATAWFFGSGAGDMRWTPHSAATGFKAATLDTTRWQALLLAPLAPLLMLLMRLPRIYMWLWPRLMPMLRLQEQMLVCDTDWHHYVLEWHHDHVTWWCDGVQVAQTPHAPRGPLGLCIWVDNQWLAATPQGNLGWGLHRDTSVLEVRDIRVEMMN